MAEQYAAPIDHTTGSAIATTAAGAAGGALKTGAKVGLGWMAATIGIGALIGVVVASGGAGIFASWPLFVGILGGIGGGVLGGITLPYVAGAGAAVGGVVGGARASNQVKQERGSAAVLQAQVEAYKAQAAAQNATTNVYATSATNENKFGFAEQGSPMNTASTSLQAGNDNRQYQGSIAGQELAAAR